MADYNTSAIGRFRFDDSALPDAYTKAGQLMQSTLQNIGQQERADFKAKQEQERLDREEKRQIERDRQAKVLFDRNTDQYNKELATEDALKSQSKIGTMGYQEGTGLLGKYAVAANAKADEAYKEVWDKTHSEDKALDAYSSTRDTVGKDLWNQQQKELKYSNALIDTAREMARENSSDITPIDRVKLTQSLATLDLPFLQKQKEASANLATELFKNVSSDKELNAASKEYTETTGQSVPAEVLSSVSKDIRNYKQQLNLEDIRHSHDMKKLYAAASLESKKSKPGDTEKAIDIVANIEDINKVTPGRIVQDKNTGLFFDTKEKRYTTSDTIANILKDYNKQQEKKTEKNENFIEDRTDIGKFATLFKSKTGTELSSDNKAYMLNYLTKTLKGKDNKSKAAGIEHMLQNMGKDKTYKTGLFGVSWLGGYDPNDAFEKQLTEYMK